LGEAKANAIVTSPAISKEKLNAMVNLLKYAQQFYGQKNPDEFSFSMFYSEPPYADLIFQVSSLRVSPSDETFSNKLSF
jgi:galactose-1-phosphate uridylyltransferase